MNVTEAVVLENLRADLERVDTEERRRAWLRSYVEGARSLYPDDVYPTAYRRVLDHVDSGFDVLSSIDMALADVGVLPRERAP